MIRLVISPSPRSIALPEDYRFEYGKGSEIVSGTDAVLFSYGPVMLNEAVTAAEILREKGVSLKVVNLPWLNKVDGEWLKRTIADCGPMFALDNHSEYGGIGDCLANAVLLSEELLGKPLYKFGIQDFPACGTPAEALSHHKLDGNSIAARILSKLNA